MGSDESFRPRGSDIQEILTNPTFFSIVCSLDVIGLWPKLILEHEDLNWDQSRKKKCLLLANIWA